MGGQGTAGEPAQAPAGAGGISQEQMAGKKPGRIGDLLRRAGLLTAERLSRALERQRLQGRRLGTNLVQLKYMSLDNLSRALSVQHGVPEASADLLASVSRDALLMVIQSRNARPNSARRAFVRGWTAKTRGRRAATATRCSVISVSVAFSSTLDGRCRVTTTMPG